MLTLLSVKEIGMESVFLKHYKQNRFPVPEIHFVLGSGFSPCLKSLSFKKTYTFWKPAPSLLFKNVKGLKEPTAPTHSGVYHYFVHKPTGKSLCFQSGRLHGYEGHTAREVAKTVLWPCLAGTRNFVLTNISGSLKDKIPPGDIIALRDHVNLTGQNPLVGGNPTNKKGKPIGPRFPNMQFLYNQKMTDKIIKSLRKRSLRVHREIYIGVLGPSLETPAEVDLFAKWGLSVVGMSTVWEAIALKHAGACVSAFSLVSNFACGKGNVVISEKDMEKTVRLKAPEILKSFLEFSHACFTDKTNPLESKM